MIDLLTQPLYAGKINLHVWGLHNIDGKHEPVISYETFLRVKARMKGKAHAPARKNLYNDFPLRQFVCCASCDSLLMGCWSKGRDKHYPYYLCQQKGCPDYGKSIKRDVIEGEFGVLLQELRPTTELFHVAEDMFRDLWDERGAEADKAAKAIEADLIAVQSRVGQFVDRVIETDSPTLIKNYEDRIKALESDKALLSKKSLIVDGNCLTSTPTLEPASAFLQTLVSFGNLNTMTPSGPS